MRDLRRGGRMYIMVVYDVEEKRVGKMLKFFRKHLHWIQNSVFEGEVTEAQLLKITNGIDKIINKNTDSVVIFKARSKKWLNKTVIGVEKNNTSNIL